MNFPRHTSLEPPTTVTPSLTMVQQAFSRVQQRLSPSRQVQPALSTVQEASETGSITSGDQASGYSTNDTATDGHSGGYRQIEDDDYEDDDDPFSDVPVNIGSRILRYANRALETALPESRPVSAEPVQRPESTRSDASSSVVTHSTGLTYIDPPQNYNLSQTTPVRAVDHFKRDTEAYASGMYRSPSRLQRSRSPTPAFDDEDYRIVGNGSVEYTGYPYGGYDEEKAYLQQDIGTLPYSGAWHPPDTLSEKTSDGTESTYTNSRFSQASAAYTEPRTPVTTRHFGPAPQGRMQRRLGYKKRVPLTNGHLTVDLDVPDRLKAVLPVTSAGKGTDETTKLRYTAVTGDPDNFPKSYWLRQNQYQRTTELFIVITMYNVRIWSVRHLSLLT